MVYRRVFEGDSAMKWRVEGSMAGDVGELDAVCLLLSELTYLELLELI